MEESKKIEKPVMKCPSPGIKESNYSVELLQVMKSGYISRILSIKNLGYY